MSKTLLAVQGIDGIVRTSQRCNELEQMILTHIRAGHGMTVPEQHAWYAAKKSWRECAFCAHCTAQKEALRTPQPL